MISDMVQKNVLLTGDTGELGSMLVQEYLNLGCRVIGVSRSPALIQSDNYIHLIEDLNKDPFGFLKKVIKDYGVPDVFVCNAAIGVRKYFDESQELDIDEIFKTNLITPTKLLLHLSHVYKNEGIVNNTLKNRSIVVVGSSAMYPHIMQNDMRPISLYAASKAGLSILSVTLANEFWRFGIRVNTQAPRYFTGNIRYMKQIVKKNISFAFGRQNGVLWDDTSPASKSFLPKLFS